MKKIMLSLCVVVTLTGVSGAAMAELDSGYYLGLDAGQSKAKDACTGIPAGFSCKNTATAGRIGAGYQINNNFGAELSYADFGSNSASGIISGVPVSASLKATGFEAAVVGAWPMTENFALTGKLGVANTKVKGQGSGAGSVANASATSTTAAFGVGLRYAVSKNIALRAQYEDLGNVGDEATTGKSKLSLWSLGVTFGF